MDDRKLVRFGGLGAVLGVIVCFTPLVLTVLAGLGLASWFGPLDSAFHVVLMGGVVAMAYGAYRLWKKRNTAHP